MADPFHERARELFAELVDLAPEARERLLSERCRNDERLRREVAELLAHDAACRGTEVKVLGAVEHAARSLLRDALQREHRSPLPARLGAFAIVGLLGEGGMGVVYLAEQEHPRRQVALKLLRLGLDGQRLVPRFRRETELLGKLQHPNIAHVHDAGTAPLEWADGTRSAPLPWFALEYVRGSPLLDHARAAGLSIEERVGLFITVCDAVQYAHDQGVIHRDLKPSNILVNERGEPKVLDFGIARSIDDDGSSTAATQTGQIIGTLPYMSPEQVAGDARTIDHRSDVYSLGVVLYQLLADRLPLDVTSRSMPEALRLIGTVDPPQLGSVDRRLRGDLETIVSKALEKDPMRRYDSVRALADDLRRHRHHEPIAARPASTLYHVGKFARRHRAAVVGGVIATVALIAATIVSMIWAVRATIAEADTRAALNEARKATVAANDAARIASRENSRSAESFDLLRTFLSSVEPSVARGHTVTLKEALDQALPRLMQVRETEPEVQALALETVARIYHSLGDLETAERLFRRSIEIHGAVHDPTGSWAVVPRSHLTRVLLDLGRLDEAERNASESYDLAASTYGRRSSEACRCLLGTALIANERGDPTKAIALIDEALAIASPDGRLGDALAVSVAAHRATFLGSAGRLTEALEQARAVVEAQGTIGGDDSSFVSAYLQTLAVAERDLGSLEEARAHMAECNALRARDLAPTHVNLLRSRIVAATIEEECGRSEAALALLTESIAGIEAAHGAESSLAARVRLSRCRTYRSMGRACEILGQALADLERLRREFGPMNDRVLGGGVAVAQLCIECGALDDAERLLGQALDAVDAAPGLNPAVRASVEQAQAELARARGDSAGAAARSDDAIRRLRDAHGESHPDLGQALVDRAVLALEMHDLDVATRCALAAIAHRERTPARAPWQAAEARALHALATDDRGSFEAARAAFLADHPPPRSLSRLNALAPPP